jgi:hypothetical protein
LTEKDLYREQEELRRELNETIHRIWQRYARAGDAEKTLKWEKAWFQVHNCQMEWIGYRAGCCGDRSPFIAVPIGCNHRLCPLCAWHRSQVARVRIKTLFDRLTHPVLITLTVPNKDSIRKHDFTLFRQRVRKFIAQHKEWIKGGVYSLETTYNRKERTWHIHCHILADFATALPTKAETTQLEGRTVCVFTKMKLRLEFDWMRLWTPEWGKNPGLSQDPEKRRADRDRDLFIFHYWVNQTRQNRLKVWSPSGYMSIGGLTSKQVASRTSWNRQNRRVVDLRPVTDRDGAAREVLKYITKAATFCDMEEAVEAFCDAVRGARLIQTFGSWYGAQLETTFDPEHMDDWSQMKCSCGLNHWEKAGVFFRSDVEMDENGRWHVRRFFTNTCRGTVPRPTIRFPIEAEEIEDSEWQTR